MGSGKLLKQAINCFIKSLIGHYIQTHFLYVYYLRHFHNINMENAKHYLNQNEKRLHKLLIHFDSLDHQAQQKIQLM